MPHEETIREQAIAWAVRAGDPEFADWDAFTAWLDANPAHAAAYDEAAAAAADAADLIAVVPPAANDVGVAATVPLFRRRWFGGAVAASLALLVTFGFWQSRAGLYTIETMPGEMRTVALAGGGSVALSGGTLIELDHNDPRFARLESGQALFSIRHDESDPFAVLVGGDRLVDAGTVFDVTVEKGRMQVMVAEGLVLFNPDDENVPVRPGQMLARRADRKDVIVAAVDPAQVGEWRDGRLTFDAAPLGEVAVSLSRMTGLSFAARDPASGSFSGSVMVAPVRAHPASLGDLLGVSVSREGERWVIDSP